jgi:hypothetical protein
VKRVLRFTTDLPCRGRQPVSWRLAIVGVIEHEARVTSPYVTYLRDVGHNACAAGPTMQRTVLKLDGKTRSGSPSVIPLNSGNPGFAVRRAAPAIRWHAQDLTIVGRAPYPNTLLIGAAAEVAGAIAALVAQCRRPVAHWAAATVESSAASGTVVLWRVETLNVRHQRHLLDVLNDQPGALQFISVAASDPFALVQQGMFLDDLYYRLSVVRIKPDVT